MKTLNDYAAESHKDNEQWWWRLACNECESFIAESYWCTRPGCKLHGIKQDPKWIPFKDRNKGELLALITSEISECLEGERKGLMDDKLPHRKMAEVELADALIRIFDYAGAFGYDLEGAYQEKREYNSKRLDHKRESRQKAGGKQF